ncbi:MAG: YcxB family protein [Gammaproteobacteria bacterium]|nr:YcxB family protein [Gammaproteobacteria bacterium]
MFNLEIDNKRISISSKNGNTKNSWGYFHKFKENKNYLLLHYSDALFLIIPTEQITPDALNFLNEKYRPLRQCLMQRVARFKSQPI